MFPCRPKSPLLLSQVFRMKLKIAEDVSAEIKSHYLFKSISVRPSFKAAAVYSYPRWENATFSQNITLKPLKIFVSESSCLAAMMPCRYDFAHYTQNNTHSCEDTRTCGSRMVNGTSQAMCLAKLSSNSKVRLTVSIFGGYVPLTVLIF